MAGQPHFCAAWHRKRTEGKLIVHLRRCKTCKRMKEHLIEQKKLQQVLGQAV